jgi:hypothetical protein
MRALQFPYISHQSRKRENHDRYWVVGGHFRRCRRFLLHVLLTRPCAIETCPCAIVIISLAMVRVLVTIGSQIPCTAMLFIHEHSTVFWAVFAYPLVKFRALSAVHFIAREIMTMAHGHVSIAQGRVRSTWSRNLRQRRKWPPTTQYRSWFSRLRLWWLI